MHRSRRPLGVAAIAVLLVGQLAAMASAMADPTLTLDPPGPWQEGDTTVVTGQDLTTGLIAAIGVCDVSALQVTNLVDANALCNLRSIGAVDGTGTYSDTITLVRTVVVNGQPVDCAVVGACVIGLATADGDFNIIELLYADAVVTPLPVSAIIDVNTAADTTADDGQCSLREGITAANTDTASGISTGECVAGHDDDQIVFSTAGPIVLSSGQLTVSSTIEIQGGPGITVDGGATDRVFQVTETGDATFGSITITGGSAPSGAGIANDGGTVMLQDSTVSANAGGGITNSGSLTASAAIIGDNTGAGITSTGGSVTVSSSAIMGNAGGISNSLGSMTVIDSDISANTGGGLANNDGTMSVSTSTVSANTGGGIDNGGSLTISNSTISGNTAGPRGGGLTNTGTMTVVFTTVTDNSSGEGAGIWSLGEPATTSSVTASIIADNNGAGGDVDVVGDLGNSLTSGGFNVVGDGTASAAFTGTDAVIGSGAGLAPLALDGGTTETHRIDLTSPAVDRVTAPVPGDVPVDQRGVERPQGSAKDSGAYELKASCNGLPVTVRLSAGESPTPASDVILGTAGDDLIVALGGDDTICAEGGDDTVNGGSGSDWVEGGSGDDVIFGQGGDDTLIGGPGADELLGFADDDALAGGPGADVINGGSGHDTLEGGADDDLIYGQSGDDDIDGGDGDDFVIGVDGTDSIVGGAGADLLNGGPGIDVIDGQDGDDTLYGLSGGDSLVGGLGDDMVFGQLGIDNVDGGGGNDHLWGNEDDDVLADPAGSNVLNGGPGHDTINGGSGADQVFGDGDIVQAGDDTLDGGLGADLVVGFAGADTITADDGLPDTINGGPGNDTCITDPPVIDTVYNCNP